MLSALRPFLSTDGLIRVGDRLALSPMDYAEKHPVVLARDSHLSLLTPGHFLVDESLVGLSEPGENEGEPPRNYK